jgi:hypothetical protein
VLDACQKWAIITALYLLLILPCGLETDFERSYAYMNGEVEAGSILGNALPPLYIGFLLLRLPRFAKLSIWALVFFPFVFPYGISEIGTAVNLQLIWGHFCSGSFQVDALPAFFAFRYFLGVACRFVALYAFSVFGRRSMRLPDACLSFVPIGWAYFSWKRYGRDCSAESAIYRISPRFHLMPMLMLVVVVVVFVQGRRGRRNSWPHSLLAPWADMPSDSQL